MKLIKAKDEASPSEETTLKMRTDLLILVQEKIRIRLLTMTQTIYQRAKNGHVILLRGLNKITSGQNQVAPQPQRGPPGGNQE